jgi:hypothetical protein
MKKIILLVLVLLSSIALARADLCDWNDAGVLALTDPDDSVTPGYREIYDASDSEAYYLATATDYCFKMIVEETPPTLGLATEYSVFIDNVDAAGADSASQYSPNGYLGYDYAVAGHLGDVGGFDSWHIHSWGDGSGPLDGWYIDRSLVSGEYAVTGNVIEWKIPKTELGVIGCEDKISFTTWKVGPTAGSYAYLYDDASYIFPICSPPVPEFSKIGIIVVLALVATVALVIVKRKKQ